MPYIAIKTYPKNEKTRQSIAEKINQIFLEEWGCKPEAISISWEEFTPEVFQETVQEQEMESKRDKMMIFTGKKCY